MFRNTYHSLVFITPTSHALNQEKQPLMNKKPPYAIHFAFIRQSTRHVSAPTGHHQVFKKQYL
jgi:hypothetical protein